MISKIRKMLLYAGALVLAASCIAEKTETEPTPAQKINTVRFTLSVPGVATPRPSSRSLTAAQEEAVSSVDVLVFYTSGDHSGKLFRREKATLVSGKTFEVKLPEGTYDLVVLANAASILDGTAGLIPQTVTKTGAAALLTASNPGGYWTDTTIPMWGYRDGVVVDETTSLTGGDAVEMHRMTAKIDVQIASAAAGTGNANFALKSVRLYNYNTKGRLAPDMANWNPTGGVVNAGKGIATAPTLPTDRGAVTGRDNPLVFGASQGVTDNNLSNTIYTFEAAKGTALALENNPCLVIGGSYQGGAETYYRVDFVQGSGENVAYLDLLRNHRYVVSVNSVWGKGHETPEEAFDSRSFNIEVKTLKWEDGGMTDVVFDGQNYLGVSPAEFDLYRNARTGLSFTVKTDYAAGWKYIGVTDAPKGGTAVTWIKTVSPIMGAGDETKQTVTFDVDLNDTGAERTAYIHIKAGRLEFPVEVRQNAKMEIALTVLDATGNNEISELVFWSRGDTPAQPAAQSFTLRWVPDTESVSIATLPLGASAAFDFAAGSEFNASTASAANGSQTFSVQPTAFGDVSANLFPERVSLVNFSLSSQGRSTSKSLFLRHIYYNLIPQAGTFLMDGTVQTFRVRANFQWKVEFVSETADGDTSADKIKKTFAVQYGGPNTDTGDPVKFTCFDYISAYDAANPQKGTITMKFLRLENGAWVDWGMHEVICYAAVPVGESNCYMIKNAEPIPILIPIAQLQYAMNGEVDLGSGFIGTTWISDFSKLKAQVLWSDVNEFGTDDAVVKVVTYNGGLNLNDGKIVVVPGNGTGNAGIILYEDNNGTDGYQKGAGATNDDIIRWSWHIWKSTYFPYANGSYPSTNPTASASGSGNKWMDRNIGAMTNTYVATNPQKVVGFMYQWGRKDPFPSNSRWTTDFTNYLHYAPGSGVEFLESSHSGNPNLTNSVQNPMTRYFLNGEPYDWFATARNDQNNDLWGGTAATPAFLHNTSSKKSVYDPCPEGYRVPQNNEWVNTGWLSAVATTGVNQYGQYNANYGGYYPAAGYRYHNHAELNYVSTNGYCWSAGSYDLTTRYNGYSLYFYSNNVTPIYAASRAFGYSVRCRAE